jgi:hypothetical protein
MSDSIFKHHTYSEAVKIWNKGVFGNSIYAMPRKGFAPYNQVQQIRAGKQPDLPKSIPDLQKVEEPKPYVKPEAEKTKEKPKVPRKTKAQKEAEIKAKAEAKESAVKAVIAKVIKEEPKVEPKVEPEASKEPEALPEAPKPKTVLKVKKSSDWFQKMLQAKAAKKLAEGK